MASPTFDPKHAVVFDLARGATHDASKGRLLLVPAAAVNDLVRGNEASAKRLGQSIGKTCGARVATRLGGGDSVRRASIEAVVTELAGELSIAGVGLVSLERWGKALVVAVENTSVDDDALLAGIVDGAMSAAVGKTVSGVVLSRQGGAARILIASEATCKRVRELLVGGTAWGEILGRLSAGGGA
jgi:hypothetical protein